MAAHADLHLPRARSLLTRMKALTGRRELDRALAAGVSPNARPELSRRAEVLRGWRVRHRLAEGLENVMVEAIAPARGQTAAVPVQREEVIAAQHDLLRLVEALRAEPGPPVRVIATLSLLLTDGTGPVFAPHPHGALAEVAFRAAFHAEAD